MQWKRSTYIPLKRASPSFGDMLGTTWVKLEGSYEKTPGRVPSYGDIVPTQAISKLWKSQIAPLGQPDPSVAAALRKKNREPVRELLPESIAGTEAEESLLRAVRESAGVNRLRDDLLLEQAISSLVSKPGSVTPKFNPAPMPTLANSRKGRGGGSSADGLSDIPSDLVWLFNATPDTLVARLFPVRSPNPVDVAADRLADMLLAALARYLS